MDRPINAETDTIVTGTELTEKTTGHRCVVQWWSGQGDQRRNGSFYVKDAEDGTYGTYNFMELCAKFTLSPTGDSNG